ncbi:aldo/keto reductase [Micromonospora sp. S-DT3-3-22]|uniref:aldo/keto reductase n=1 Tax=Micromonospora sp. S-DT3-3-22 TaxID=2755359 RepID=UPI001E58E9AC|nr:aldo/keto reductase [Micromonospora sp. S-DT3-3-22]
MKSTVVEFPDTAQHRLGVDTIDLHRRDPGTPTGGDRRGDGRTGRGGLGTPARPVGGQPGDAAHGPRGAPDRGRADGVPLFSRDVEGEMPDTCRELGVALVAYSPVGRGLLTGAITGRDQLTEGDWRAAAPRFAADDAVAGERHPAAGMRTVGHWSIDRRLRTLASGPGASLRTGQGVRLRALRPDRTYGTMARWITLRCRRPPSWPTGPTGCARPPSARWSGSCCVAATPGGPPPRTATSTSTCW